MKKLAAVLALLAILGCAGKKYAVTEGPFRGKFRRAFSIQYVGKIWKMYIFFDGVLPKEPLHVEGYLDNNGTSYYQHHSDIPPLRTRMFNVTAKFTWRQYCESVGRPMDRFDASTSFWNRGQNMGDPSDFIRTPDEDAADGKVVVRFRFFTFVEDGQGDWGRGKLLAEVRTRVKLECPMCDCGGQLR